MNVTESIEKMTWQEMKRFAGTDQKAIYRQEESELEIDVVRCSPTASSMTFGDSTLYENSCVFEIDKKQIGNIIPKEGDELVMNDVIYPVTRAGHGPCWVDVGVHGITIQIHTTLPRT